MVNGVGTDLVEIGRIERACKNNSFLNKIFTEEERRQAQGRVSALAGNFAVKEAVAKCLGTGFRGFLPGDIEVLRDQLGKPFVNLMGGAKERMDQLGIRRIEVSISNTKEYALGFAVGEGAVK